MRISDWSSDVCSSDLTIFYSVRLDTTSAGLPVERTADLILILTQRPQTKIPIQLLYQVGTIHHMLDAAEGLSFRPPDLEMFACTPHKWILGGFRGRVDPARPCVNVGRSEERRVGKECVGTIISRRSRYSSKKKRSNEY